MAEGGGEISGWQSEKPHAKSAKGGKDFPAFASRVPCVLNIYFRPPCDVPIFDVVNQNVFRQAASAISRFYHCLERGRADAPAPQEKAFRPTPVAKCSAQNQTIDRRSIAILRSRPYVFR